MQTYLSILHTPIGSLVIEANDQEVFFIGFKEGVTAVSSNMISENARNQLAEYFEGKRTDFDFPFAQTGTDFQQSVWTELMNISMGKPISYASLAKKMKRPLSIRAIAAANGQNKLMIVVPCHRVIGSHGDLVGYAGEIWRKKWLLEHESTMAGIGQTSLLL